MRVDEFDFELPESLIALRPSEPREAARLLVVGPDGTLSHRRIADLPALLDPGDILVVNDTKVISARFTGRRLPRPGGGEGAKIEVTLHKRVGPSAYRAFVRPAKRLAPGDRVLLGERLEAVVVARDEGEVELSFASEGAALDSAIAREGEMPLPPYIAARRPPDARDRTDYQTIYAEEPGSVASPTAGLHFTPDLFARLEARGIVRKSVTLHVGGGTFLPVSVDDTADHRMHAEWASLSAETASAINEAHDAGHNVVAAGTTTLRTLETAGSEDGGSLRPFVGETSIFITPGYRFKVVDVLLTNFHLPRSTLFMLVCAFSGTDVMKAAYAEAIAERYRFYSYGDACLLFRPRDD